MFSKKEYAAIVKFSKLSLSQLRRYQTINKQQTKLAYESRIDEPQKTAVLLRVQRMADIFAAAIDRKCFS